MPNVVAIIQDDRVRKQTEQFLQELGMDSLRFATFANHQEFTSLYFRDRKTSSTAQSQDPSAAELKLFSEINLLIFALDSIGEKAGAWIDKVRSEAKRYDFFPKADTLRMILLKYEDDGIAKAELMHPMLDDLIFLPLDRLVMKQKVEILVNLPKRVKPSFLFNQAVHHQIEISKLSKVDRLSDVALAMRNPVPLKKGLAGHFYIQLPGEKDSLEIHAKVLMSIPHPELPGQYLIYFSYFGLQKQQVTVIRRALSKSPRYQSLLNDDREAVRFDTGNLFPLPGDDKLFEAVVIDAEDGMARNLARQLTADMDRLKVSGQDSYSVFLRRYLEEAIDQPKITPLATTEKDFYGTKLHMHLGTSDGRCLSLDPGPEPGDKFLGHDAKEVFSSPENWLDLIMDQDSKLILRDCLALGAKDREIQKLLILKDGEGTPRAVKFTIEKGGNDKLVTAFLEWASLDEIAKRHNPNERGSALNLIILNSSFVPDDSVAWIAGLRSRAVQVGLCQSPEDLKFILIFDADVSIDARLTHNPDILGLIQKPVDNRQILFLMSVHLQNRNTLYNFDNMGWTQPALNMHVAKDIEMEALSEFGATLKSRQQLTPGTTVFLRKSIFTQAPNSCLAARVYACEPHANDKDYFSVYTTYFGINDQFLKFARTWIRENYATQKGGD